jgi:hypothetical protein
MSQLTRTSDDGTWSRDSHPTAKRHGVGKSLVSSSVGWELGEVGSEITRKNPSTQPTIQVTVGFHFDVRMNNGILAEW